MENASAFKNVRVLKDGDDWAPEKHHRRWMMGLDTMRYDYDQIHRNRIRAEQF